MENSIYYDRAHCITPAPRRRRRRAVWLMAVQAITAI